MPEGRNALIEALAFMFRIWGRCQKRRVGKVQCRVYRRISNINDVGTERYRIQLNGEERTEILSNTHETWEILSDTTWGFP